MRTKLLLVLGLCCSMRLAGQMANKPHATLYHPISGKNALLNFNQKYFIKLHSSALEKLNNFTLMDSNTSYLTLINQIGDTLVFKEGKLLATDIDKLVYTNRATVFFTVMATTVFLPIYFTFTYIEIETRYHMLLAVPPTIILTNLLIRGLERRQVQLKQYQLIPQNLLGKEPKS
jgi:hypothetical protein